MLLKLPPNYQHGGVGTATPVFYDATREAVFEKMRLSGRVKRNDQGTEYYQCVYCQHDPAVLGWNGLSCFHPQHLVQIDHIMPFARIKNRPRKFYFMDSYMIALNRGLVENPGLTVYQGGESDSDAEEEDSMDVVMDDGANPPIPDSIRPAPWNGSDPLHLSILYNDMNNLHAVCTGHNQHKGDSEGYLNLTPDLILRFYQTPSF